MAIQVSEQLENQIPDQEFKGAVSNRSRLAVDSKQFSSQIVGLKSDIPNIDRDTHQFVGELSQLASDRLSSLSFPTFVD